jgi:hypothetical protein
MAMPAFAYFNKIWGIPENDDHDDASVLAEVHQDADHKLKSLTGAGKRKPSAPVCRCGASF